MLDALKSVGNAILDGLNSVLQTILYNTIYKLLYYIDAGVCWIVGTLYKMFGIFAGVEQVVHKDGLIKEKVYLLDFFVADKSINTIYWYMAVVGLVLCFGFTIIAVIRKMADLDGKQQRSYGQIFRSTGKSILIILLMTSIMSAVMMATNVITESVNRAFNAGSTDGREQTIEFTGEQYATMARILNTIGNYSLNPAPTSRYNINACFNDIRPELLWLQDQGVFDFYYLDKDANGQVVESWQSILQKVANAADLRFDMPMDVYNESLTISLRNAMSTLKNNASLKPLSQYSNKYGADMLSKTPLDVILFLMGTSEAAYNQSYNISPSITDNLRGAYYIGEKSIYDVDAVMEDFDIAIGTFDHILILFGAFFIIPNLAICIFNAIARMFNLLLLYLMAPLAIAPTPMDDGGKFKQWTTAFVIQCFGILGIIVSMRLLMVYLPLVYGTDIVFFDGEPVLDIIAKLLLLIGGTEAAKKASGIITGILADNAGIQSIAAGDMSDFAGKAMSTVGSAAKTVGGLAADATGVSAAANGIKEGWNKFAQDGGVFGLARDSKDVRDAQRQRDVNKKLDDRQAEKDKKAGKDPDAAAKHSAEINANAMAEKFKSEGIGTGGNGGSGSGDTGSGGNKTVPPTSSDEFNEKLNADVGPGGQENLAAK